MFRLSPFDLIVRAIVLLTTIPIHESAHAYAAYRLGDPTAKNRGRLSLNPARHFDLMGSFCMIAFGIGWAKPVPINRYNFRDRKKGMALSAAAGPASNLVIAVISMIVSKVLKYMYYYNAVRGGAFVSVILTLYRVFVSMCVINISLAIFNLMPFPPFDGSRIFNYFLSDKYYFKIMEYERYIFMAVLLLLYIGLLDRPLAFLNGVVYSMMDRATIGIDFVLQAMTKMRV